MDNIITFPNHSAKLKSLELFTEEKFGVTSYFLKGVWEFSNDRGLYELTIPKISLNINGQSVPKIVCERVSFDRVAEFVDLINGPNLLAKDDNGNMYYVKAIEKYPQKMTLSEIEKKLGYKIELVSEK